MKSAILAVAGLGLALSACGTPYTPSPAQGPRVVEGRAVNRCFDARDVDGFASSDQRHVNLSVGREVYRAEVFGTCQNIDFSLRLGIVARPAGTRICQGNDADLIVPSTVDGLGPQRCTITRLRQLTQAEIEALPRNDRP